MAFLRFVSVPIGSIWSRPQRRCSCPEGPSMQPDIVHGNIVTGSTFVVCRLHESPACSAGSVHMSCALLRLDLREQRRTFSSSTGITARSTSIATWPVVTDYEPCETDTTLRISSSATNGAEHCHAPATDQTASLSQVLPLRPSFLRIARRRLVECPVPFYRAGAPRARLCEHICRSSLGCACSKP
jgi:hypothetical protein